MNSQIPKMRLKIAIRRCGHSSSTSSEVHWHHPKKVLEMGAIDADPPLLMVGDLEDVWCGRCSNGSAFGTQRRMRRIRRCTFRHHQNHRSVWTAFLVSHRVYLIQTSLFWYYCCPLKMEAQRCEAWLSEAKTSEQRLICSRNSERILMTEAFLDCRHFSLLYGGVTLV